MKVLAGAAVAARPLTVSRRLRFEVLHRDSHTCRYCGAQAPDAVADLQETARQIIESEDAHGKD